MLNKPSANKVWSICTGLEPFTCRKHLVKKKIQLTALFGIGQIHTGVKDRVSECLLPFSAPSVIFLLAFKNAKIKIHKTVMLHVFV
jgi:hypothetical protein